MTKIFEGLSLENIHHTYICTGDRGLLLGQITKFAEDELGILTRSNPDFWIGEFESFGVEDSRYIKGLQKHTSVASLQVFVIATYSMTREAQNAFLKVTEEPSKNTCFFFIVPSSEIMLPTMLSRAVHVVEQKGRHVDVSDAELFIGSTFSKRMKIVDSFVKNNKKGEILSFINHLEYLLAVDKNPVSLHAVYETRKKIYGRSPSVKTILEHLAIAV